MKEIEITSIEKIKNFGGEIGKIEIEPIAFGLKALKLFFILDEGRGNIESLENNIMKISGVNSVGVLDVRRAIG